MPNKLINATPHAVVLHLGDGRVIEIPSSPDMQIRLKDKVVRTGELDTEYGVIPLSRTTFEGPEGQVVPDYQPGVYYIVSRLVKSAYPDRKDFLVPNESIRNEKGQIIGCLSLSMD